MANYDINRSKRVASAAREYAPHATNEIPENVGFYVGADGDYTIQARIPAPGQATATNVTLTLKEGQFVPIDTRLFTAGDDVVVLFFKPYE